jgi:hypothetical protein
MKIHRVSAVYECLAPTSDKKTGFRLGVGWGEKQNTLQALDLQGILL